MQENQFIPPLPKRTQISQRVFLLLLLIAILCFLLVLFFFSNQNISHSKDRKNTSFAESIHAEEDTSCRLIKNVEEQPDSISTIFAPIKTPSPNSPFQEESFSDGHNLKSRERELFQAMESNLTQTHQSFHPPAPPAEKETCPSLEKPSALYEIKAGTLIPAVLETGIQSDLPGNLIARVRKNVFDTLTGNYLLIPQGATLLGLYDSKISYGQSRVLVVWTRIIFPNGDSLSLEEMPGVDRSGMTGMKDRVNNHYGRIFGSAILMSVFSTGLQLSQPQKNEPNGILTTGQLLSATLGQNIGEVGTEMIRKNLSIPPTIEIRPGALLNLFVTKDLSFPKPYASF